MHDVDAFEAPVSAYPAVTVIRRAHQAGVVIATTTSAFQESSAAALLSFAANGRRTTHRNDFEGARLDSWFEGRASWPSANPTRLALVADLERRHPLLEDPRTGTRVGIGLATGADASIWCRQRLSVEGSRPGRIRSTVADAHGEGHDVRNCDVVWHLSGQPMAQRSTRRSRALPAVAFASGGERKLGAGSTCCETQ